MANWVPNHRLSIAFGAGGSYVEVPQSLLMISPSHWVRSYGRQSPFVDTSPGTFTVVLDNRDGRFTPDNAAAATAAGMAFPLTDGMGVNWEVDGTGGTVKDFRAGTITGFQVTFEDIGSAATSRVVLTVTDQLGPAARHALTGSLSDAVTAGVTQNLLWTLADSSGAEASGSPLGPLTASVVSSGAPTYALATFGTTQPSFLPTTGVQLQAQFTSGAGDLVFLATKRYQGATAFPYPGNSAGFYGFWVQNISVPLGSSFSNGATLFVYLQGLAAPITLTVSPNSPVSPIQVTVRAGASAGLNNQTATGNGASASATLSNPASPHYVSIGISAVFTTSWAVTATAYVDGAAVASSLYSDTVVGSAVPTWSVANRQPVWIGFGLSQAGVSTLGPSIVNLYRLSHTMTLAHEEYVSLGTEAGRLTALAAAAPEVSMAAPPAALSAAPIGNKNPTGQSVLDAANDVIRTEQGQIYASTGGTLLAPVPSILIRERTRPPTVTATFALSSDVTDAPQLVRDLSNTVATINATGVTSSGTPVPVTVTDTTAKVSSAAQSFEILNSQTSDITVAAQDRINRGKVTGIQLVSFVVNGMGTNSVDRSTDLLGLTLGNRYQVAALPTAQLGYSTWDFFLIGVTEDHTAEQSLFTLYCEAAGPRTGIYDTDRFMAGTDLTLSGSITSGATTMSIATVGAKFTTAGSDFPQDVIIDSEQMTISTVSAATPQVFTISARGTNGTTAAAHAAGAPLELATPDLFAF